jgi:pyruvate kinase
MPLGPSSLGRCESRVVPTLDALHASLSALCGDAAAVEHSREGAFYRGLRLLRRESRRVFGPAPRRRQVYVMATLPAEAAESARLVRRLVDAGMDVARINCAHDDPEAWSAMARHVRRAAADAGRSCRVAFDMGGPRARTASVSGITDGARLLAGDRLLLVRSEASPAEAEPQVVCTLPQAVEALRPGETVCYDAGKLGAVAERVDARSRSRPASRCTTCRS